MAHRKRRPGSKWSRDDLIQHFRGNWIPAERELLALPAEDRRELFMPIVEEVLVAHRKWHATDCTRPRIWWECYATEPRDPDRFHCEQLHAMGELNAAELRAYPAALAAAEEQWARDQEYYRQECEYHAKSGHWRTPGGAVQQPRRGNR